jgi:histidinol-phosphate phosphatase family protein
MRLLVHGRALTGRSVRMRVALEGLALRGHDVVWLGPGAPATDGVRRVPAVRALHADPPDLVASAGSPAGAVALSWRSRARGLVLDVAANDPGRWSVLDRAAWDGFPRFGLVEASDGEQVTARMGARDLQHLALWPGVSAEGAGGPAHADTAFLESAAERVLAAARGPGARFAVFLDRDGTLIVERGYLSDPEGVELLPGAAAALRQMQAAGAALVVVSNQAGVGRGRFTVERAWATMARLRRLLRAEGVELDAIRFCPHRPDEGCRCRKPGTALLEDASEALHLSLAGSVMAGDRWLDAAAGRAAGGMGVLLRTGYGREEEARIAAGEAPAPDLVLDDLPALAAWVAGRLESL